MLVSTHSRLKAAGEHAVEFGGYVAVSTHSRLKAAGRIGLNMSCCTGSFNTQPPEGGWIFDRPCSRPRDCFNTQPPEGGWTIDIHARGHTGSFNTQPPEGGWLVRCPEIVRTDEFQHTAA